MFFEMPHLVNLELTSLIVLIHLVQISRKSLLLLQTLMLIPQIQTLRYITDIIIFDLILEVVIEAIDQEVDKEVQEWLVAPKRIQILLIQILVGHINAATVSQFFISLGTVQTRIILVSFNCLLQKIFKKFTCNNL